MNTASSSSIPITRDNTQFERSPHCIRNDLTSPLSYSSHRADRNYREADGYVQGAPEIVAEISASSVSIDLHTKLKVCRRNGVKEYIAWRVLDRAIDWFVLREGEYAPLTADAGGILRSEVFPGLWLNVPAMLEGKLDVVLATLQQGIASPEHKAFVTQLASCLKP